MFCWGLKILMIDDLLGAEDLDVLLGAEEHLQEVQECDKDPKKLLKG